MLKAYVVRASDFHDTQTQDTVEDIIFNLPGIRVMTHSAGYLQVIASDLGDRVINLLADCDLLEIHAGMLEEVLEMLHKT